MVKPGILAVTLACLHVLQLLPDRGHCIAVGRNLSPPEGSVIAELLGPANVMFNCDQFRNDSGENFTQRTTQWSFKFASDPSQLVIFNDIIHPEFDVNGTIRDPPVPFTTFRNILTLVNFTERLDGTRVICGQGSQLEVNEWTLRVYRPATLRTNFIVKVVERDGNIPVNLSMEPTAFPTPGVFQWSMDGMLVNSNGEINYTYPTTIFQRLIRRSDSGNYSLTATNHRLDTPAVEVGTGTGNFILDILYGPDITPGPMQHYVLVGDAVSLVCGTSLVSNPGATISWRDVQGMEIQNAGRYAFDNGPATVQLTFSFTRASDTGVWTCGIVVIDNDVMTASEGRLVPRDNKGIGEEMYPIMLIVVVPPSEPRNVAVDDIDATQATLSWREPSDLGQPLVSGYKITADDLTNEPIVYMTQDNGISNQIISGLLPGVFYQFTVRAITKGGDVVGLGISSIPVQRSTLVTVPAPVCKSAVSVNGIITVSWSFIHTGGLPLTNLSVFYTFSEGLVSVNQAVNDVCIGATSVMVPGLQVNTEYTFSVIVVNSRGSAVSQCMPVYNRQGTTIPPTTGTTTGTTMSPPASVLYTCTGVTVGVSVMVTFILSVLLGLAVGVTVTYFIMVNRIRSSRQSEVQEEQTTPAPVYEEVESPQKKEFELETNLAYGPIGH